MAGLTTALLVGTGIAAAGNVGSALIQKKAADKAVDSQVDASTEGLALQKHIYDEQKAGMAPYAAFGQHALGSLGELMGFPASASTPQGVLANAVGRDANGNPLGPVDGNQPPMNMNDPRVRHLARGGSLVDFNGDYGDGSIGSMIGSSTYGTRPPRRGPAPFAVAR